MIVLDSSFFVAFKNRRDIHHAEALEYMPWVARQAPMLVHEYAFVEMVTVLAARVGHAEAVESGQELLDSSEVEFVPGSPSFTGAWARFWLQKGTVHSLADAAMLQLAEERGATHIATFDREFRKAKGLKVVPGHA